MAYLIAAFGKICQKVDSRKEFGPDIHCCREKRHQRNRVCRWMSQLRGLESGNEIRKFRARSSATVSHQ